MSGRVEWTTPSDVREQVERHWEKGRILSSRLRGDPLFPLKLRLKKPDTGELGARFDEVRRWIRTLEEGSKGTRGFGYEIEWEEINHRQLGRNRVPAVIAVPTELDALRLIHKVREAERFQSAVDGTLRVCPELRDWLGDRPRSVLEHIEVWERLIAVVAWFRNHPRPCIFLRQVDIPGVDTKLIETHKGLLSELLDRVLPQTSIDARATGARGFEQRYGLRSKPALVRFRILDPRQALSGLTDLCVPAADFAQLDVPSRWVFITENEINGLAFPPFPDSMVLFGLGYGLERLAEARWLATKQVMYWGDIDTHGFAILDRLRSTLPNARSFLMDRESLMAHQRLWGQEQPNERQTTPLTRLTPEERSLFDDLRADRLGERVRLEQERIAFGWVLKALSRLRI